MARKKGQQGPQYWKSGPDPVDHRLYTDCQRARAQAWYRGEEWLITEAEYIALWRKDNQYLNKGRKSENVCLVRKDYKKSWCLDNVEIISRHDHNVKSNKDKNPYLSMLRARERQRVGQ
jgi:hypothetical protein